MHRVQTTLSMLRAKVTASRDMHSRPSLGPGQQPWHPRELCRIAAFQSSPGPAYHSLHLYTTSVFRPPFRSRSRSASLRGRLQGSKARALVWENTGAPGLLALLCCVTFSPWLPPLKPGTCLLVNALLWKESCEVLRRKLEN